MASLPLDAASDPRRPGSTFTILAIDAMSDSKMYIPPQGLYFRLFGYASQRVLFSRTHAELQVFHHPVREEYNDQFFTLVPGTGVRKGLYLMKRKHTNKVLFSRTHSDPHVGHINGNVDYNDKYVMLSLFVSQGLSFRKA